MELYRDIKKKELWFSLVKCPLPVGLSEGKNIFSFQRLSINERKGYGMNVFEAVKNTVTARQAAEYYGIKVTGKGMACCPLQMSTTFLHC